MNTYTTKTCKPKSMNLPYVKRSSLLTKEYGNHTGTHDREWMKSLKRLTYLWTHTLVHRQKICQTNIQLKNHTLCPFYVLYSITVYRMYFVHVCLWAMLPALNKWLIDWWKLGWWLPDGEDCDSLTRLVTIPACDRQTDRQTNRLTDGLWLQSAAATAMLSFSTRMMGFMEDRILIKNL